MFRNEISQQLLHSILLPFLYIGHMVAQFRFSGICSFFHTLHQYLNLLCTILPPSLTSYAVIGSSPDVLLLNFLVMSETSCMEGIYISCSGPKQTFSSVIPLTRGLSDSFKQSVHASFIPYHLLVRLLVYYYRGRFLVDSCP